MQVCQLQNQQDQWLLILVEAQQRLILSLGGVMNSTSVKAAGDRFDEAIMEYMRTTHKLALERLLQRMKKISVPLFQMMEMVEV